MTPAFSRVMRAGSLALGYPDAQWRQDLPLLHATADAVAGPAQAHLRSFLSAVAACPAGELQQAYVETFDLRRRCCPHLTYYSCGDTRKRGMALLQFTAAYRVAGFELADAAAPWLTVVDAIRAVLPDPAPRDLQRALDLARSGPPAEEVGLEPFAPPEYMGGRR